MILVRPYSYEDKSVMVECQDEHGNVYLDTYTGDFKLEIGKVYEGEKTVDNNIIIVGLYEFE